MCDSRTPLGRSLLSPLFVVCVLVLIVAAVGLRPGLAALREYYRKEPIWPRRPLAEFDFSKLASFEEPRGPLLVYSDGASDEDVGTEERLFKVVQERGCRGGRGQISLLITYYSDPNDPVPHTPDVCSRQAGLVVTDLSTITVETPGLAPDCTSVEARTMRTHEPAGDLTITYVFCVNGRFEHDRQKVRWTMAMPGDRYAYFSKVEVGARVETGEPMSVGIERGKKLLGEALTILVKEHFPRREDLKRR